MQLKPVRDQVVVVFGASSGIGRETARQFARRGAKVLVAARNREAIDALAEELRRGGADAASYAADVTDFNQVQAVARNAVDRFDRLDTWVHLSAVYMAAPFEQTTPDEFRRIIDVNLNGQAFGAMAALPHLRREGRGALIHVSSLEGIIPFPLQSAYAASKHGVVGFLDSLRLELERDNAPISVTNVIPGTVNTPLFDHGRSKLGVKPMASPPVYDPKVVADVILFAAENPSRELYAGGSAKALSLLHRISPRLSDSIVRGRMGSLETSEPKPLDAPDNLFYPTFDPNERGSYQGRTSRFSFYNFLETHPTVRRVAAGTALGAVGLLAARAFRTNGYGSRYARTARQAEADRRREAERRREQWETTVSI